MKIKGADDEVVPVNRKLILIIFVVTGFASLLLWWNGNGNGEELQLISPVVESRLVPTDQVKKENKYKLEIKDRIATMSGTYAIYVYNLNTKRGWGINDNEMMEGASLMKILPMLTAIDQINLGKMQWEQKVGLLEVDRSAGSGPLQYVTSGTQISLERIISEMGLKSDNTGWRMLNRVLGKDLILQTIQDIDMKNTDYVEYTTTASDVAKMFERVSKVDEVKKYLVNSIYEDRITLGIPKQMEVVHKVGTLENVWEDAGIVKCKDDDFECKIDPFILVILNKDVKREQASDFVVGLTKLIWQRQNEAGARYFE